MSDPVRHAAESSLQGRRSESGFPRSRRRGGSRSASADPGEKEPVHRPRDRVPVAVGGETSHAGVGVGSWRIEQGKPGWNVGRQRIEFESEVIAVAFEGAFHDRLVLGSSQGAGGVDHDPARSDRVQGRMEERLLRGGESSHALHAPGREGLRLVRAKSSFTRTGRVDQHSIEGRGVAEGQPFSGSGSNRGLDPTSELSTLLLTDPDPRFGHICHTRGMRKFGRPDLVICGLSLQHGSMAADLLHALAVPMVQGQRLRPGVRLSQDWFQGTCEAYLPRKNAPDLALDNHALVLLPDAG